MFLGGVVDLSEDVIDRHLFDHALRHDVVEVRAEQLPPPIVDRVKGAKRRKDQIMV